MTEPILLYDKPITGIDTFTRNAMLDIGFKENLFDNPMLNCYTRQSRKYHIRVDAFARCFVKLRCFASEEWSDEREQVVTDVVDLAHLVKVFMES